MADCDSSTEALASQLYNAWNSGAPASVYAELRDQVLAEHEHIDTRIATLVTVVNIACPSIGTSERQVDASWDRLFSLATSIDSHDEVESNASLGKRKRTCNNEAIRTRNLAVVSSLWSLELMKHYGWNAAAQGQAKLLRACAVRFPHFKKDFIPRLNCLLLCRHQEAIQFGRRKTLNEAPLQPQCDLDVPALQSMLPDAEYEDLWVKSTDGLVPIYPNGTLLKDLRPHHFQHYLLRRDRYGMLIARERSTAFLESTTRSAPATIANCSSGTSPSLWTPNWIPDICYGHPLDISLAGEEGYPTVWPLALHEEHPVEFRGVNTESISTVWGLKHGIFNFSTEASDEVSLPTMPAAEKTAITDAIWSDENCDQVTINGVAHAQSQNPSLNTLRASIVYDENISTGNEACEGLQTQRKESCHRRSKRVPTDTLAEHAVGDIVDLSKPASVVPTDWSYPEVHLTLQAPLHESKPTLEGNLLRRYDQVLRSCLERLSSPLVPNLDGDRRRLRTQWLTPETKLARLWASGGLNQPLGRAKSEDDADVLYYSSEKFVADVQAGKVFQKPVVIKESFSDTNMHTAHTMASIIEDTSGAVSLEVQDLDNTMPIFMDATRFSSSLRTSTNEDEGLHTLNLRTLVKAHKPVFTAMRRFRLLDSLTERLYPGPATDPSSADVTSCVSFNIAALAGAFSGPRVDAVSGTWARVLDGVKFWMFVPEYEMNSEWEKFEKSRASWTPNEKQRMVILEKDDVVFIPPGLRILHAAFSPGKSVIEGGMFWDELEYLSTLAAIPWMCESQRMTYEQYAFRLPGIINRLEELVLEHPDRFCKSMPCDKVQESFHHVFTAMSTP